MRHVKRHLYSVIAIISDVFNLDREHDGKVSKYDFQDVHMTLKNAPVGTQRLYPDVGASICNRRGVMAEKSFRFWRGCDIPRSSLMHIHFSALQHSYKIWRPHKCQSTDKRTDLWKWLRIYKNINLWCYSMLLHLLATAFLSLIHVQGDQGPSWGH